MSELEELREKAEKARKTARFVDAAKLFKNIWNHYPTERTIWDGWGLAYSLMKIKNYEDCLKICKETYEMDKSFVFIKSVYAWVIYIHKFNKVTEPKTPEDFERLLKYLNNIIQLTNHKINETSRINAVLKVADIYIDNSNWLDVIDWLNYINPEDLSDKAAVLDSNNKKIIIPSDKEKYFNYKTKALEGMKKYNECIEECDLATSIFPKNIWYQRRKALCLIQLGKKEEALDMLLSILTTKKDWFIYADITALYLQLKDYDKALEQAIGGCLAGKALPSKENQWELYYNLGLILRELNQKDFSDKHLFFALKLREKAGWKISSSLLDQAKIDLSAHFNEEITFKELLNFWEDQKFSKMQKESGTIKNILPNNKTGFIKGQNRDYYFKISSFNGNKSLLKPGLKVTYFVMETYDKLRKQKSFEAINIEPYNKNS